MGKYFSVFSTLLTGIVFLCVAPVSLAAFVTNLSDAQIEKVLNSYFPINEYAASARITLNTPQVRLEKNINKVMLVVPVVANISGGAIRKGHATIQVNLAYKAPTGGLYFSEPNILQFDIPGVDGAMLKDLREIVDVMGKNSIPLVRIYSVKERELNHSLDKSRLKSFVIEDGRLHLEFGFN